MTMTKGFVVAVAAGAMVAAVTREAQAATVQKVTFKGNQVSTFFSGSTTINCAGGGTAEFSASGFLSGAQQLFKSKGSPKTVSNGVFVDVSFFNGCTSESRFASGGISGGFAPPNRTLAAASLEGSTVIQDFGDGATFPFSLDVEVVGEGPVSAGRTKSHTRTVGAPGNAFTITHSDFSNANRAGTASGTVTVAGVTLTPEFSSTTLIFNSNSVLTIEH